MTDIVERLRRMSVHGNQTEAICAMEEAADEIECLASDRDRIAWEREQMRVSLAEYQAKCERLRAALMRIDGINDNPAIFNEDIDTVIRLALNKDG